MTLENQALSKKIRVKIIDKIHAYVTKSMLMTQGKQATPFTPKFVIPFVSKHAPIIANQAIALNQAILQSKNDCPYYNKVFHGNANKFSKCQSCHMSIHPSCKNKCFILLPDSSNLTPKPKSNDKVFNTHCKLQLSSPQHPDPPNKKSIEKTPCTIPQLLPPDYS